MKKHLALLLVLCLGLTACAGGTAETTTAPVETTLPEPAPEMPALMWPTRFTGLEQLESNSDYRGGYLYQDRTEDGLTIITNCCFATTRTGEQTLEDYLLQTAAELSGTEPVDFTATWSEEHTLRMTYPVYLLRWTTGGNEDLRGWDAFAFLSDTHTYVFAFDTDIDFREELDTTRSEVFGALELA